MLFFIDIVSLLNYVDNGREKFYELMEKYPYGTLPDNWNLLIFYKLIKHTRCCGIDSNKNLSTKENHYFYSNFPQNCLKIFTYIPINFDQTY